MRRKLKDLFMGFLMGCSMSVPGVSGGTMAMTLGYYTPLLSAAAELRDTKNIRFLFRVFLGGISGFLLGAKLLGYALKLLPLTVTMLFCGAVLAGIWVLGKQTVARGISVNGFLFFLLGFIAVLAVEKTPENQVAESPLLSVIWGIFLAAGLILPGISTSHLLTVFGLYGAVSNLSGENLLRLLPLAAGTVFGIFLLTKPLAKAIERYPAYCNCALLGFSAGSLKGLIEPCIRSPQISYLPRFQIINGIILAAGAVFGILALNRRDEKVKKL